MTQQILYSNIYCISSSIQSILIQAFSSISITRQQRSEGSAAGVYLVVFVLVHVERLEVEEAVLQRLKHRRFSLRLSDVATVKTFVYLQ